MSIDILRAFAEGRIHHLNNGLCPDVVSGYESRDPDCAVCQALSHPDDTAPAVMSNLREAAQQALDAMCAADERFCVHDIQSHKLLAAIESLRAALAQPDDKAQPVAPAALGEVIGCFEAAFTEGLQEALAETKDERLKDLIERRLMHALYAAQNAAPQPPAEQFVIPAGYALVPLRMNRQMEEVVESDDWQWGDLLAAADAIDEAEYNEANKPAEQSEGLSNAIRKAYEEGYLARETYNDTEVSHLPECWEKSSAKDAADRAARGGAA